MELYSEFQLETVLFCCSKMEPRAKYKAGMWHRPKETLINLLEMETEAREAVQK